MQRKKTQQRKPIRRRRYGRKKVYSSANRKYSSAVRFTDNLVKKDPTIDILNYCRPQYMTTSKTLSYANCNILAGGVSNYGIGYTFDPAGVYGNYSSVGGPASMPDWASFSSVFDFYRVNYIKIHLYADTNANLDTDPIIMWCRYNYEPSVGTPTLNGITQLPKVMKKTFSSQNTHLTYVIRPTQVIWGAGAVQTATALTTDNVGYNIVKHKWTDVNKPVRLYGFQLFFDNTTTAQTIKMEVEYNVSFRYGK